MLINGEKWACEACVRGHRVSNCQHSDRVLQHINKKGRPVSQCHHCRALRKSRAAHVKCDCGEKTHKCVHLRPAMEGHKESCCCNHGAPCTCSHKKEPPQLDTVPESDSDGASTSRPKSAKGASRSRRRANTTNSDGVLSFDSNGHHKPAYKHTKASQKSGPYPLNRVHSLQSTSSLSNGSVDNLFAEAKSPASSSDGVSTTHRLVKSEAASPLMTGSSSSFAQLNGQLAPLDLSSIKYQPYVPNSADFFGNMSDHEQPMFSAGLSANSVDWSNYDLDYSNKAGGDFAPSSFGQPQSFGGFDFSGSDPMPTLTTTTSTSGEVSEVEDLLPSTLDDFDSNFNTAVTNGAFSMAPAHPAFLASTGVSSVDFDTYRLLKANTKFLPTPSSLPGDEPTMLTSGTPALSGFTFDDEYWMGDYIPHLTDSPTETGMPSLWDQQ